MSVDKETLDAHTKEVIAENRNKLIDALNSLNVAMKDVHTAYDACMADEVVFDAFIENYPFTESFDESVCKVSVWTDSIVDKLLPTHEEGTNND